MLKGILGPLLAAAVLFAAGGVSVAVLGKNELDYTEESEQMNWDGQTQRLLDATFTGKRTWEIADLGEISAVEVDTSGAKTCIAPSDDGSLWVTGESNGWNELTLKADYQSDGTLSLSVGKRGFHISFGSSGTVTVYVPEAVYDRLDLKLGSGTLEARGLSARENAFDIGSGRFEFEQKQGFTADEFRLEMGSGSVTVANAAADSFTINMGSGSFNVGGLTGSGKIFIGSGSGTAEFASADGTENLFDLGSGKLTVYIPDDTRGELRTDIGSGSVTVDCCGVSERITGDSRVKLNGGGDAVLRADLGSGKVELRGASEYKAPDMFDGFPEHKKN